MYPVHCASNSISWMNTFRIRDIKKWIICAGSVSEASKVWESQRLLEFNFSITKFWKVKKISNYCGKWTSQYWLIKTAAEMVSYVCETDKCKSAINAELNKKKCTVGVSQNFNKNLKQVTRKESFTIWCKIKIWTTEHERRFYLFLSNPRVGKEILPEK